MGLFKKNFGITLIDGINQHRISHAQRLLATTDTKIVEVALASGFNPPQPPQPLQPSFQPTLRLLSPPLPPAALNRA